MKAPAKTIDNQNLLEGPLFIKMLLFVLPLMLTNLLQTLYSAADMIVVSLSDVSGAIGAIGTTGAMLNLLINVFIGFSVGANVVVARSIGAGEQRATEEAVHTSMIASVIFGFFGIVVGEVLCEPILRLMGDEGDVLRLATLYSRIYIAGAPAMCVTNYAAAIFRARGDTKTPLMVLSAAGLANVVMNLFFVLVLHMSVDGVALATVLSNVISAVWLVLALSKDERLGRFHIFNLQFSRKAFGEILYVGLPAGIQSALFSLSNMLIQSSVVSLNNTYYPGGSTIIDGNAAASSLENFAYTAANSVYHASVTFSSQHFGAGKHKRFGAVIRDSYLLSAMISVTFAGILLLFHTPLLQLYVREPAAMDIGFLRMKIMLCTYFLCAFMEVGSGILRGLGRSVTSTVVSLLGSCVFRVLWITTVFKAQPSLEIVYLSYPISWLVTSLVHFICGQIIRRKYRPLGDGVSVNA